MEFKQHANAYWLIFSQDRLLASEESPSLMQSPWDQIGFAHEYEEHVVHVGEHNDLPCYLIDMRQELVEQSGLGSFSLRSFFFKSGVEAFEVVARAWQLALFLRTHKYCGQCGHTMDRVSWEMAMLCQRCGHRVYPRISPCIIVAIRKGDRILLAQGKTQKERQMFSTLAGFVESGESLENAVHREVFEEVGISVKNLEYFGSQPWPFPHSLMVGYLADYDAGEINVDGEEILEAHWFDIDNLPIVPPNLSIAGQLIETMIARIKQGQ